MADVNNIEYIPSPDYEVPFTEVEFRLDSIEFKQLPEPSPPPPPPPSKLNQGTN